MLKIIPKQGYTRTNWAVDRNFRYVKIPKKTMGILLEMAYKQLKCKQLRPTIKKGGFDWSSPFIKLYEYTKPQLKDLLQNRLNDIVKETGTCAGEIKISG